MIFSNISATGNRISWRPVLVVEEAGVVLILTTRTSLSPIRRGFAPSFVNYKKGCTRLAAASDKVYQIGGSHRHFFKFEIYTD
jgi:hypothetical protein